MTGNNLPVEYEKFLPPAEKELQTDLDYARKNLYDIIETGVAAMQEMSEVARQSQNPRAFEVLGNLLKTMADINQQLIDVSEKKSNTGENPEQAQKGTINNNLFLTTSDLSKMIEQIKENKKNE